MVQYPSEHEHPLGYIIRPVSGAKLPVLHIGTDGTIVVQGTYVAFETSIRTAARGGYRLEEPTLEMLDAWERFASGASGQ